MQSQGKLLHTIRKCGVDVESAKDWVCAQYKAYAMEIIQEFVGNPKEQQQILQEGFRLLFTHIHQFDASHPDPVRAFKYRVRLMMICSIVAYARKYNCLEAVFAFDSTQLSKTVSSILFGAEIPSFEIDPVLKHFSASRKLVLNLCLVHGLGENELALSLSMPFERARSLYRTTLDRFKNLVYKEAEQMEFQGSRWPVSFAIVPGK